MKNYSIYLLGEDWDFDQITMGYGTPTFLGTVQSDRDFSEGNFLIMNGDTYIIAAIFSVGNALDPHKHNLLVTKYCIGHINIAID